MGWPNVSREKSQREVIAPCEDKTIPEHDNLEHYLEQVDKTLDISRIIDERPERSQIINYYLMNRFTYRLFYNWEGFFHCGISYNGKCKSSDCREQAKIIDRYIHDTGAKRVLELGYGLGANSGLLARRNPNVTFDALDMSNKPLTRFAKISNAHFYIADYHDLSNFEDGAYGVIFIIEALCYSKNKLQVFDEVKKKISRDGLFIVFDAYTRSRTTPLSYSEDIMWKLIARGGAGDPFEYVDKVEDDMRKIYSVVVSRDLSTNTLPSLERQESLARLYFSNSIVAKAINKILPFDIVKNLPMMLLMPTSVRRQIGCYYLHVLQNDH
jgi:SAM-dependent methyltransferase